MPWVLAIAAFLVANQSLATEQVHIRLVDRLDRSHDGYCFDILGTPASMRVDLPLFAHNCKRGPTPDSTVVYTTDGELVFPAASVCVTGFGVNGRALPGVPLLLRPCSDRAAFFDAAAFQQFDRLENGQLRLRGHNLCVAVGTDSATTYSVQDRWRVLSLELCSEVAKRLSVWEFVPLH